MARVVKDFVDLRGNSSLDELIEQLVAIRDTLPADNEAEVKLRGDDVFGRKISIAYRRPQSPEEAECEARYVDAHRQSRQREADESGVSARPPRGRRLRMVA